MLSLVLPILLMIQRLHLEIFAQLQEDALEPMLPAQVESAQARMLLELSVLLMETVWLELIAQQQKYVLPLLP